MNDVVQSLIKYAPKSPYWGRPEVLDEYPVELALASHHNDIDRIPWKELEPRILKGVGSVGWRYAFPLPDEYRAKLLERKELLDPKLLQAVLYRGWYAATMALPQEVKDRLMSDENKEALNDVIIKRTEKSGWNEAIVGQNYSVVARLLRSEGIDAILLNSVENSGWGSLEGTNWDRNTDPLMISVINRILSNENVADEAIIKGINKQGWAAGTLNLPARVTDRIRKKMTQKGDAHLE